MKIALVYNERPTNLDRNDPRLEKYIEGDEWKTIKAIGDAVIDLGHEVKYCKIDDNIYETLKSLKPSIDLIFNFSEGINNSADREAHIPLIAEILGIPYTGPGPLSAALILNKSRAKEIWKAGGISTANWQLFKSDTDILDQKLSFPLIVKPNGEGSGIGIKSNSVVHNHQELKRVVFEIVTNYHQNALVEEYLPGREFTIGLIGNDKDLMTLPIIEINFDAFPKGVPPVDTFEAKFVYGATGLSPMLETEFCPAQVSPTLEKQLLAAATSAYQSIGCRDFGRVDLRLGNNDQVYVMEINHPPGLMSDPLESSFFTIAGRVQGWTFKQMIDQILTSALKRLGIH